MSEEMVEIGAHSASKDPRRLFKPDPERNISYLSDKGLSIIGGGMGYAYWVGYNAFYRLPLHVGVWRHILTATIGIVGGHYYNNYREERMSEYNALIDWYIREHPEEFPAPERRKMSELLKPWIPLR